MGRRAIPRTAAVFCLAVALTGSREVRSHEAASASTRPSAADAGTVNAEDLDRLRSRIAALERQITQPRNDAQSELLRQLTRQIEALREELAQEQASRTAAQISQQQARERLQASVAALAAVQERLASGDAQVIDDMDAAAPSLPFPAQERIRDARAALQREDLASARYSVALAIALAQRTQLAP